MNNAAGKVYLVGAGPGDPELLTLRGRTCLEMADLVLYDYLVNPQILEHAPAHAERVCLGRHGQGRIMSQQEVNERMIASALEGQVVVRLKGGDPIVFARAADEIGALQAAGVPLEIVPGITAALAAGSYAAVPITHRHGASSVALVTGQEGSGKASPQMDYAALAKFPGSLVFYMGVTTAPQWTRDLMEAGKAADTPAAIVRRCSWPDQQVIRCRLDEITGVLAAESIRPPVILILGDAAARTDLPDWFGSRPLVGRTVLISRPLDQARESRSQLQSLGAEVLVHPAISISEPDDWSPVDAALAALDAYDWLVFSSANGVRFLLDRLLAIGGDVRRLARLQLAAIGPATAETLASYHLRCDLAPREYRAEALAAELGPHAAGCRFLLARASRGREVLAEQLIEAGGDVQQIVVYKSSNRIDADPDVREKMQAGQIDWTTVTSSAIARALKDLFGDALHHTKLAAISPLTAGVLAELGLDACVTAAEFTTPGLIQAILAAENAARDAGLTRRGPQLD